MKVELMHDSIKSSMAVDIQEPSFVKRKMRPCSLNRFLKRNCGEITCWPTSKSCWSQIVKSEAYGKWAFVVAIRLHVGGRDKDTIEDYPRNVLVVVKLVRSSLMREGVICGVW